MAYIEKICIAGDILEIFKYHSFRHPSPGNHGLRSAKVKLTSDRQKKINSRQAERTLRWKMNANFHDGDYLVRLDFGNEPDIDVSGMQGCITKAIRKIRDQLKHDNIQFKFIYVKEIGSRGSKHIHMMCSKIDTGYIAAAWDHGGIHVDPLTSGGQYRKVAEYFIKYSDRTEETLGQEVGKRWYSSRNLIPPIIKTRVIGAATFSREAPDNDETKGYLLEKETVTEGVNGDGYEYFSCSYIRGEPVRGDKENRKRERNRGIRAGTSHRERIGDADEHP